MSRQTVTVNGFCCLLIARLGQIFFHLAILLLSMVKTNVEKLTYRKWLILLLDAPQGMTDGSCVKRGFCSLRYSWALRR